jgi:thymidylate synthase (FAD)
MGQIKVELQETMGGDRSIADSAWTSSLDYQKKQTRTDEDVKRIVNMLADSGHSTPFESVIFRFWIKMSVACDRQFMTHRLQSASGMSGRYRTMPNEFLQIPEDVEKIIASTSAISDPNRDGYYTNKYNELCTEANSVYNECLSELKSLEKQGSITNQEYKRAREFYRGILPQHNMTERVSVMNLRAFANFYKLRSDPAAQPEIQEVAKQMLEAVKASGVCPVAIEALERNGWDI